MVAKNTRTASKEWTAAELRKLPPGQRDAVLEAAASAAEDDYRNDRELTAFEAFDKEPVHGDSSSTEAR